MDENSATVRRTKKIIMQTFLGLLNEKSFEKITTQNILLRAEVSKSTFYKYFQDKYDLLKQSHKSLLTEYVYLCEEQNKLPVSREQANVKLYNFFMENAKAFKALTSIKLNEFSLGAENIKFFVKYFQRNLSQTSLQSNLQTHISATFYIAPFFSLFMDKPHSTNLANDEKIYAKEIYNSYVAVFAEYMKVDKRLLDDFLQANQLK